MRTSSRLLLLFPFALLAAWPLLLFLVHLRDPVGAVRLHDAVLGASGRALWWLGGGALVLALLWPPFPAAVRHAASTLVHRLQRDARPYQRAVADLRNFESPQRQLEAGRAAIGAGDNAAAVKHLLRAVELDPELLAAHHQLGVALLRAGRTREALPPLRVVVERDPGFAFGDALLRLGRAHMQLGEPAAAADLLRRHRDLHGGNRRSHFWLGRCLLATGDREGAVAALRVAAAPPPQRPRLTSQEALFRARARTSLWLLGRRA